MIQVPIGSTSTCAPSRSRNRNMLKLPSPSVVCAQNSPVILTIGFTRSRSISIASKRSRQRIERRDILVALDLVDEFAQVLGGIRKAAQVLRHVARRASTAASCGKPRAGSPSPRPVPRRWRRCSTSYGRMAYATSFITSPQFSALRMPRKKSRFISSPASASDWLRPPDCWNSSTRKPSKPELRSARRYSASYMPKRQGPHAPAVKNT